MQVHPYLNFNGQCEEAFKFYEECLGGRIVTMMSHGDSPIADQLPAEWHASILHARMDLGGTVLMGSDNPPGHASKPAGMYVALFADSAAEAERVFHALAENGQIQMPMEKTFWAERFGMLTDRFGTQWMINCELSGA